MESKGKQLFEPIVTFLHFGMKACNSKEHIMIAKRKPLWLEG